MKKFCICLLALLMVISLASCANKSVEPPVLPEEASQSETAPQIEIIGPALMEVNIYHLGIRTPLTVTTAEAADLAGQLYTLLEAAAEEDSLDTVPADSPNPIQVTAGRTALEVVYKQVEELPLKEDGAVIKARRLLYSVPSIGDDGGLLFVGEEIYDEIPLGKLFSQDLQQAIYNSAADQVEKVVFSADGKQVDINGQTYAYDEDGDNVASMQDMLLSRMLYRSIAFYLNAYTGNVNGLTMMSTAALTDSLALVISGIETENYQGEQQIANLNKYILAEYFLPQTIMAPMAFEDDTNTVRLILNENVAIDLVFMVQEDMPLVNGLHIVDLNPADEAEDVEEEAAE